MTKYVYHLHLYANKLYHVDEMEYFLFEYIAKICSRERSSRSKLAALKRKPISQSPEGLL